MSLRAQLTEALTAKVDGARFGVDVEELVDVALAVVQAPETRPHGLTLCKVCRAPTRPKEGQ